MSKNRFYTIVLDYKGGTYIGQSTANSVRQALTKWLSQQSDQELARWKINRDELQDILSSDEPIPLGGCTNVWCLSGSTKRGLALINIIATDQAGVER